MNITTNDGQDSIQFEVRGGRTVEIVDINVRSEQRKGVGTWLINQAISTVSRPERQTLYAITRSTNVVARKFYAANGFHIISRIESFYQDQPNSSGDALVYGRRI